MAAGLRTLEPDQREERASGAARTAPAAAPHQLAILALQQGVGNAAVARAMLQRDDGGPATGAHPDLARGQNGDDVDLLQLKLNWHLGFMRRTLLDVDGDFGGRAERAVIAVKRATTSPLRPARSTPPRGRCSSNSRARPPTPPSTAAARSTTGCSRTGCST